MPPNNRKVRAGSDSNEGKPRNITEMGVYKSGTSGVKRFWTNYKKVLRESFTKMDRVAQEDLITKFSMIVTMGVTVLMIVIFYGLIPAREFRVFGVPLLLITAWWLGNNLVANVVIARMEGLLNKDRGDY